MGRIKKEAGPKHDETLVGLWLHLHHGNVWIRYINVVDA